MNEINLNLSGKDLKDDLIFARAKELCEILTRSVRTAKAVSKEIGPFEQKYREVKKKNLKITKQIEQIFGTTDRELLAQSLLAGHNTEIEASQDDDLEEIDGKLVDKKTGKVIDTFTSN